MEALIEILEQTPWWVYLIFVYLLIIGSKASRRHTVTLQKLFMLPLFFTLWSLYGLYERWHGHWSDAVYWIVAIGCGSALGWWMVRKWNIHTDRQRRVLILPGTWSVLALSLSFFALRYCFGYYYGTHPSIPHSVFIADLILSGLITGLFIGRTLTLWRRYENPA
jgi:uncharacterized protein YneF (UPF0154 family)